LDKQHFFLNQGDALTRMGQPERAMELYKQAVQQQVGLKMPHNPFFMADP
jgi:hypothetical protein